MDAHSYAGWTYDYFFKRFGRRGWNDADLATPQFREPRPACRTSSSTATSVPEFFANAFYCCFGVPNVSFMVYGVGGLPSCFGFPEAPSSRFAGSLEIVAHELTHGVTAFTSRLSGAFCEAGGLNESFSDQMGVSVGVLPAAEHRQLPAGRGRLAERLPRHGESGGSSETPTTTPSPRSARSTTSPGVPNQALLSSRSRAAATARPGSPSRAWGREPRADREGVLPGLHHEAGPELRLRGCGQRHHRRPRASCSARTARRRRAVTQAWQAVGVTAVSRRRSRALPAIALVVLAFALVAGPGEAAERLQVTLAKRPALQPGRDGLLIRC